MTHSETTLPDIYELVQARLGVDVKMRTAIELDDALRQIAGKNPQSLLQALVQQPITSHAWQSVIDALTIGETYFFRDLNQFNVIRQDILPRLIQQNQQTQHLVVWCAGCATGEEAYSLATVLAECLPHHTRWKLTIVGTDIYQDAIAVARQAVYREWSFRHDDNTFKHKYFTRSGNEYVLHPTIQQMVMFRQANLLDMPRQPWAHLILCRNVLLYFGREAKKQAEHLLHQSLYPGGWMLLGHAEALHHGRQHWQTHMFPNVIAYQKPAAAQAGDPTVVRRPPVLPAESHQLTRRLDDPTPADADALDAHYLRAIVAYQHEQHERAEQLLAGVINRQPNNVRARVMLAAVFANRAAYTEANVHLGVALHEDPMNADAHYLRAMLHLEDDQTQRAEDALRAALYSQPGHPLAAFTLGTLRAQQHDVKRARSLWQQALDAAEKMPPGAPISDFNPRNAADFAALLRTQLRQIT